jgi:hypothetical protein
MKSRKGVNLEQLVNEFNRFFEGSAEVRIAKGRLEITIGSQTLIMSLPEIIGVQSTVSS